MSYTIGVCDDDREFVRSMSKLCADVMEKIKVTYVLKTYYSEEDVLKDIAQGAKIDLLFLDILLGHRNGIDLAMLLKERGEEISVVLMTVDSSFLLAGYSVQPIYFLMKPIEEAELEKAIRIDLKQRSWTKNIFIKCDRKQIPVPIESISYLEVTDHMTIVHTKACDYVSRTPLAELINELPQNCFARCHNSFAVNLARVTLLSRTQGVVLDCRVTLPIGRKYYDSLRKKFMEFMSPY